MTDIILIAVIFLVVCASVAKIVSDKKKGVKCIGCPYEGACKNKSNCGKT
jgi:hypothetical protein